MTASPDHDSWSIRHHAVSLALLALLCSLIYSNTLQSPMQWDEGEFLKGNPIIQDLSYYYSPSRADGSSLEALLSRRYVGYLSFALNYRLHGYEVAGYHAVNTGVHIFSSWLVYALGFAIACTSRLRATTSARAGGFAALFGAALFAAHPVQTEAVTYVFQRLASMSAMFYLASVAAYAYARAKERGPARYSLYLLSVLSAFLAMKTKENAFTLPLAILLYEYSFHEGPWRQRIRWLIPFAPLLFVIPLSVAETPANAAMATGNYLTLSASLDGYTAYEYLITQSRVIVTYIRMLILPVGQNVDHDYPLYMSALEPAVIASSALILTLLALSVKALRKSRSGGAAIQGVLGYGTLWFFLTLSVESSIIPIPMLINEYRMYLPSAGPFISFSFLLTSIATHSNKPSFRMFVSLCIAITIALGLAAYKRNSVWQSKVSLWEDVVRKSPMKTRGLYNLAHEYFDSGNIDGAIEQYEKALKLKPDVDTHINLGVAYKYRELPDRAIAQYIKALALNPLSSDAYNNLGIAYQSKGMLDEAVKQYENALRLNPDMYMAHYNLGSTYMSKGLLSEGIANFREALRLNPDYAQAHNSLGSALGSIGSIDEAARHFKSAIALTPDFANAHYNLGVVYKLKGLKNAAQKQFLKALELNPDYQQASRELMNLSP